VVITGGERQGAREEQKDLLMKAKEDARKAVYKAGKQSKGVKNQRAERADVEADKAVERS
jgi:hypothetical protein